MRKMRHQCAKQASLHLQGSRWNYQSKTSIITLKLRTVPPKLTGSSKGKTARKLLMNVSIMSVKRCLRVLLRSLRPLIPKVKHRLKMRRWWAVLMARRCLFREIESCRTRVLLIHWGIVWAVSTIRVMFKLVARTDQMIVSLAKQKEHYDKNSFGQLKCARICRHQDHLILRSEISLWRKLTTLHRWRKAIHIISNHRFRVQPSGAQVWNV